MTLLFFLDFPQAFTSFVDKTVSLYTGSKLEKFDVSFRYYNSFSSVQPDEWIRFAIRPHPRGEIPLDFIDPTISHVNDKISPTICAKDIGFEIL